MVKAIEKQFSYRDQRDLESALKRSRKQGIKSSPCVSRSHKAPTITLFKKPIPVASSRPQFDTQEIECRQPLGLIDYLCPLEREP